MHTCTYITAFSDSRTSRDSCPRPLQLSTPDIARKLELSVGSFGNIIAAVSIRWTTGTIFDMGVILRAVGTQASGSRQVIGR